MPRPPRYARQGACFVVDCSVVLCWFFADEANAYADAVAARLAASKVLVPIVWPLEVANTLVVGERRNRSTAAQASAFLARLSALPIELDEQTARQAWSQTIGLARMYDLSSYDAAYLELALRARLPLATLDDKLRKAAIEAGISIYQP